MSTKKYYDVRDSEAEFGPMTIAMFVRAFREADEISQTAYAKKLKISRANLCDIEKGRKLVSPARAVQFARILGVSDEFLIQLSIQDSLRAAKLKYTVELKKIS